MAGEDFLGAPALGFGGFANANRFGRRSVLALGVPNTGAVGLSAPMALGQSRFLYGRHRSLLVEAAKPPLPAQKRRLALRAITASIPGAGLVFWENV